ncbi:hypothetical protein ACOMHN_049632 [Nucella lapillus]
MGVAWSWMMDLADCAMNIAAYGHEHGSGMVMDLADYDLPVSWPVIGCVSTCPRCVVACDWLCLYMPTVCRGL